jgi:hypothetical protein
VRDSCDGSPQTNDVRTSSVILHPYYWRRLPVERLLAAPTDGKAVTKLPYQDLTSRHLGE